MNQENEDTSTKANEDVFGGSILRKKTGGK